MNRNTKRVAKERSKKVAAEHAAGRKVTPEPSKRHSPSRGGLGRKTPHTPPKF